MTSGTTKSGMSKTWAGGVALTLLVAVLAVASIAIADGLGFGADAPEPVDQVAMCHEAADEDEDPYTLFVDPRLVGQRLAKGETLGACEDTAHEEDSLITVCRIPGGDTHEAVTMTMRESDFTRTAGPDDMIGPCTDAGLARTRGLPVTVEDALVAGHPVQSQGQENETPPPCRCPQNVDAFTVGNTIQVEWSAASGAEGYRVYRATGSEEFTLLAEVGPDTTSLNDANVEVGTTYRYTVNAFAGDFETDDCPVAEATAIPDFPTVMAGALASVIGIGSYVMARRKD